MRQALFAVVTAAALLGSWTGCSDDSPAGPGISDDAGPKNPDPPVRGNVGAAGGSISAAGITLRVPAGALDQDVTVSITRLSDPPPAGYSARSALYRFEPAGLQFRVPAEIEWAVEGSQADTTIFWSDAGQTFTALPSTVTQGAVRASVSHFSMGFAGVRTSNADAGNPADGGGGACEPPRADLLANGSESALAWNGEGYGAAWYNSSNNAPGPGLYFARLDASGKPIGAPAQLVGGAIYSIKLVSAGNGYGLAFSTADGTLFRRLDASGQRIGQDVYLSSRNTGADLDLSFTGSEFAAVWQESQDGNYAISLARIDANARKLGEDIVVRSHSAHASSPRVTFSGTEYGVVWVDSRDHINGEIYFARVNPNGQKSELRMTSDDGASSAWPQVRWADGQYGVFFFEKVGDENQLRFARVSASGARLGGDVTVSSAGPYATVSPIWTGSAFGLTFGQADGNLALLRLDAQGNAIGSKLPIARGYESSLAWTGSGYRLVWSSLEPNQNITVRISPLLCP